MNSLLIPLYAPIKTAQSVKNFVTLNFFSKVKTSLILFSRCEDFFNC